MQLNTHHSISNFDNKLSASDINNNGVLPKWNNKIGAAHSNLASVKLAWQSQLDLADVARRSYPLYRRG